MKRRFSAQTVPTCGKGLNVLYLAGWITFRCLCAVQLPWYWSHRLQQPARFLIVQSKQSSGQVAVEPPISLLSVRRQGRTPLFAINPAQYPITGFASTYRWNITPMCTQRRLWRRLRCPFRLKWNRSITTRLMMTIMTGSSRRRGSRTRSSKRALIRPIQSIHSKLRSPPIGFVFAATDCGGAVNNDTIF